jgi:CRP-like cAMP-binding protein
MANSVIVNQGHPAEHFFQLVSGRARYFDLSRDGRKVNLKWLAPGDIFSPGALLSTPSEYLLSTEAVKDSLVWCGTGPQFGT